MFQKRGLNAIERAETVRRRQGMGRWLAFWEGGVYFKPKPRKVGGKGGCGTE